MTKLTKRAEAARAKLDSKGRGRGAWRLEGTDTEKEPGSNSVFLLYAPEAPDTTMFTTQQLLKSEDKRCRQVWVLNVCEETDAQKKEGGLGFPVGEWKSSSRNGKQHESLLTVSHEVLQSWTLLSNKAHSCPWGTTTPRPPLRARPVERGAEGGLAGLALNPPPLGQIWKEIVQHDILWQVIFRRFHLSKEIQSQSLSLIFWCSWSSAVSCARSRYKPRFLPRECVLIFYMTWHLLANVIVLSESTTARKILLSPVFRCRVLRMTVTPMKGSMRGKRACTALSCPTLSRGWSSGTKTWWTPW